MTAETSRIVDPPGGPSTGLITFPQSLSLPTSPTPDEDPSFSILPRYLLQKVKNTFAASSSVTDHSSSNGRSSHRDADGQGRGHADSSDDGVSHSATASSSRLSHSDRTVASSIPTTRTGHAGQLGRSRQLRDERNGSSSNASGASASASRNPRIATLAGNRRAVAPVLSKAVTESSGFVSFGGTSSGPGPSALSRSQSRPLSTLPESPLDESAPSLPQHTSYGQTPFSSIPGFPLNRDPNEDAKSASSVAASNLGLTQIFRRLRGETLSRDYWMSDESAIDCYDCNVVFTVWRRKHHCRICGRIFCSRCASHILPGSRFGHEGLVRICDLCLAILTHQAERDRDQRVPAAAQAAKEESIGSDRPALQASTSVANMNISLPLETSFRAPQSQFSASVLFPRNDFSHYNLSGAANLSSDDLSLIQRRARRFSDASLARPDTPDAFDDSASPMPWHPTLGSPLTIGGRQAVVNPRRSASPVPPPLRTPAPFRKTQADEEKPLPSPQLLLHANEREDSPLSDFSPPPRSRLDLNDDGRGLGIFSPGMKYDLPQLSAAVSRDPAEHPFGRDSQSGRPDTPSVTTVLPSIGLPHVRSRLNSRAADQVFDLADIDTRRLSEVGYLPQMFRTQARSLSFVNDVDLAAAALAHTRRLLAQFLKRSGVLKARQWEDELLKILVNVARYVQPRLKEGDSMDVRKYIKIKRIPGGTIKDCEYVDGVVFTKSLLNKRLPRFIANPRIMVFDYAFEYEHDENKMVRLDHLRESERDSLRKLVNSVIDHRPHVVLVSKNVSGLALEYLHKANIVVSRNVKPSVINLVARCTRASIYNTYQHFPDTSRPGRCHEFRADTIEHKYMPGGRKTYLRLSGCHKDMGATILLRGGDVDTLTKIKKIMRFMVLAVYSVRLEMCMFWDEHAAIPPEMDLARMRQIDDGDEEKQTSSKELNRAKGEKSSGQAEDAAAVQREIDETIRRALRPYTVTILSTSPTVVFPPPHSLERLRDDNLRIEELRSERHEREATITPVHPEESTTDGLAAPAVVASKGGEPEGALEPSAALTRSLSEVSLLSVKPQARTRAIKVSAQLAQASQISEAEARRNEHLIIWQNRLARHQDNLYPVAHQHLTVLESIICTTTLKACIGPRLVRNYYYKEGRDESLRQYIERTVAAATQRCQSKTCDKPGLAHYTTFAHGTQRLHMVLETYLMARPNEDDILVWSYCKVCGVTTDITSLSAEAGNYSFAKYLEVSFYNDQLFCRFLACPHNIHKDHVRYFAYKDMAIRIFIDFIDVSDVAIPPLTLRVDAWIQLKIKNEEFGVLQKAMAAYWDSVLSRIRSFNYDLISPEKQQAGRATMQDFAERAAEDKESLMSMLDAAYESTPLSRPSSLNAVRHALNQKAISWDKEFLGFEQQFIPSDAERARRMTSSHLRRLFSDPNSSMPSSPNLRGTFSPLPSVPTSPVLSAHSGAIDMQSSQSLGIFAAMSQAEAEAAAARSQSSASTPSSSGLSTPQSEGELNTVPAEPRNRQPEQPTLDSVPALRLTEANLAQIPQSSARYRAGLTHHPSSIVDHGELRTSAGGKARQHQSQASTESDSDSTVVGANASRINIRNPPESYEQRSESEDLETNLAVRAYNRGASRRAAKPVPSIANLVQRFEATPEETATTDAPATPLGSHVADAKEKRPSLLPTLIRPDERAGSAQIRADPGSFRPGIRRGKSDYTEVRNQRAKQARDDRDQVLSEGDTPSSAPPPSLCLPDRNESRLKSPAKQSRPNSPTVSKRRWNPAPPPLETRWSHRSTVSSASEQGVSAALKRSSTTSSRSTLQPNTIKGKASELSMTKARSSADTAGAIQPGPEPVIAARRDLEKPASLKVPAARDPKVTSPKASPSFAPRTLRRGPSKDAPGAASNNRVTMMARHFNTLSREAEREKQKSMAIARRRMARPTLAPRATANVFVSSKEALKDDSDDEGSSSGADDEMGPDDDEDRHDPNERAPAKIDHSRLETDDTYIYERKGLGTGQATGKLGGSAPTAGPSALPPSAQDAASGATPDSAALSSEGGNARDAENTANSTDNAAGTESSSSISASPHLQDGSATLPKGSHLSESEMSSAGTETRSFMKTLSSLWNYRGADFAALEYPLSPTEHLLQGSNIIVREDEPSSFIAHGLDSKLYRDLMREGNSTVAVAAGSEAFMPDQPLGHGLHRASNWDVLDFQADAPTDLEEAMKRPADRHLRLAWHDADIKCTMKVFFADQFDALRKNSRCEEVFVESLARCIKWDAVGGKSGSAFLKTKDDRFIIKEISHAEMTAFLQFAPRYFEYMSKAFFHDLPTVLAKIFGVFRVSFRNASTGKAKKFDVLVIENIYYGKTVTRQYDLKGSLRNRHVEVSADKTCVLLDENLLEMAYDRPLYVREHTKKNLEIALHNDSLFLANNKIMDYSLIVGVDKESLELVVGIIDFLRPYTWDKRLETWVKETAYIGGGAREPTILNPRTYKTRFREAMSRYFVLVPDRWTSHEAVETGQPEPQASAGSGTVKGRNANGAAQEDQNEQYAGGSSRAHSPHNRRRLIPLVAHPV